jgi:hypothetical protein
MSNGGPEYDPPEAGAAWLCQSTAHAGGLPGVWLGSGDTGRCVSDAEAARICADRGGYWVTDQQACFTDDPAASRRVVWEGWQKAPPAPRAAGAPAWAWGLGAVAVVVAAVYASGPRR